MAVAQGEIPEAYTRQMELAQQCFEFATALAQRTLVAQMDGSRRLFELQGQPFGALESDPGDPPAMQWAAWCRRSLAASAAVGEVCLRTASTIQAETASLLKEYFPAMNRAWLSSMEGATRMVLEATGRETETPRKRAA